MLDNVTQTAPVVMLRADNYINTSLNNLKEGNKNKTSNNHNIISETGKVIKSNERLPMINDNHGSTLQQ